MCYARIACSRSPLQRIAQAAERLPRRLAVQTTAMDVLRSRDDGFRRTGAEDRTTEDCQGIPHCFLAGMMSVIRTWCRWTLDLTIAWAGSVVHSG